MRHTSIPIILVSTMAFTTYGAGSISAEEPSIEDLVKMWSARQAGTKTATFHWGETLTRQKELPQQRDYLLRIGDGANMRSESIPLANLDKPGEPLSRTGLTVSAFNGKRNEYYTSAASPDDHHRGIEFNAEFYDEIVNYHLQAVILSYRPLLVVRSQFSHKGNRIVRQDTKLVIVDRNATLGGTPCLIVESRSKAANPVVNRYWVDITRRGLILKHAEIVTGRVTAEVTISYKKDPVNGWVPILWKGRFLNSSIRSLVLDYTINKPIEPELFEIAYPAGTVVFDRDHSKRWRILTDGTRELISPAETGEDVPHEEESVMPQSQTPSVQNGCP